MGWCQSFCAFVRTTIRLLIKSLCSNLGWKSKQMLTVPHLPNGSTVMVTICSSPELQELVGIMSLRVCWKNCLYYIWYIYANVCAYLNTYIYMCVSVQYMSTAHNIGTYQRMNEKIQTPYLQVYSFTLVWAKPAATAPLFWRFSSRPASVSEVPRWSVSSRWQVGLESCSNEYV